MAPKQQKQEVWPIVVPDVGPTRRNVALPVGGIYDGGPSPVVATTYLCHRKDGKYLIRKVSLLEDGTTKLEPEFEHPNRMVARERLRVLLDGVLP